MQIGQVPIQFVPEPVVNDTRAVTMEPQVDDALIPSLAPFAPEPVAVVVDEGTDWNRWIMIGGLLLAVWWLSNIKRR